MENEKIYFENYLQKCLSNPEIKKEYDALEVQYLLIKLFINKRKSINMTQKQLSELTGINQSDISKLESGKANPTLELLNRIANAMDMKLKIELIPKEKRIDFINR